MHRAGRAEALRGRSGGSAWGRGWACSRFVPWCGNNRWGDVRRHRSLSTVPFERTRASATRGELRTSPSQGAEGHLRPGRRLRRGNSRCGRRSPRRLTGPARRVEWARHGAGDRGEPAVAAGGAHARGCLRDWRHGRGNHATRGDAGNRWRFGGCPCHGCVATLAHPRIGQQSGPGWSWCRPVGNRPMMGQCPPRCGHVGAVHVWRERRRG